MTMQELGLGGPLAPPWSFTPLVRRYRVLAGQMRELLMAVVLNMTRIACIVSVAASMSIGSASLHDLFTTQLPTAVNQLFTGSSDSIPESINKNLVYTVAAMGTIDAVQAPTNDVVTATEKARAADLAIFGAASPPMAAGAMLLLYQFTIALFIGLALLFILCLLFDQTKELFRKWLMYGIGTLFSIATLCVISSIVLKLTVNVAAALWTADIINSFTGQGAEGFSSRALEQGGIGLLLTVLIVSVPPLSAAFFQGTMGNFLTYSAFGMGSASRIGPQGQPPGSYGHGGGYAPPVSNTAQSANLGYRTGGSAYDNPGTATRLAGITTSTHVDAIRPPISPGAGSTR